jgi:hypothetical protein
VRKDSCAGKRFRALIRHRVNGVKVAPDGEPVIRPRRGQPSPSIIMSRILDAPKTGMLHISALQVARCGARPVGSSGLIRTQQQINSRDNLPKQTTAVIQRP